MENLINLNNLNNSVDDNQQLLKSIKKKKYEVKLDMESNIKRCKECKSIKIIEHAGHYVCQDCGIENELIIDQGQEWRFYGSDDSKGSDPSRCGMPTNELLPNSSIGSSVGFSNGDARAMKKIRIMNNWYNIPYRESSLLEAFNNITILCENAGINSYIIEEAKIMYKAVSEVKHSRRIKKEAMKAASVFLACEMKNVSRSVKEIASIFNIKDSKVMSRSIKSFEEIWQSINNRSENTENIENIQDHNYAISNINNISSNKDVTNTEVITEINYKNKNDGDSYITKDSNIEKNRDMDHMENIDEENNELSIEEQIMLELKQNNNNSKNDYESLNYLHRHCSKLNITNRIYDVCKEVLIYIETNKILETHNPLSRVSSVIYFVSQQMNININKTNITRVCNISEVTINKCYHKLLKYHVELFEIIVSYN